MDNKYKKEFEEINQLLYFCETGNNLENAETLLKQIAGDTDDTSVLAKTYGMFAQVENYRFEYANETARLAIAEKGVKLARKGLEYDDNCVEANSWAASMMGIHGLEMGILSSLFYLRPIKEHAEKALKLDATYHYAQPHLILGELYRLSPPSPIGVRDMKKSLEHLLRSTELGGQDPQAKFHLAELYLSLRKKDLARQEISLLFERDYEVRGPVYIANWKAKAHRLQEKLG